MTGNGTYPIDRIRADFPILSEQVRGKPLVYLDNGASAQKPSAVIDQISRTYETEYANVHRGVHYMSQMATDSMEAARVKAQSFLNAADEKEIIFVRGATEGINLVASSWGRANLSAGDEIILSVLEHHSNIVPWQIVAEQTGAVIKVVPIDDDGEFLVDEYEKLLSPRTRMVAVTHVSNALGTVVPVHEVIRLARAQGAAVLLDGCQAVPHIPVDVQALDVDFYVFSGHKLYGPSGIGVLYGKQALLEAMPPYQGGGEMIDRVTFEKTTYADLPFKFEAGTPHIAGIIALGTAIDYLNGIGFDAIAAHEKDLLDYATDRLTALNTIKIVGTAAEKAAILSFNIQDVHPHDVGTILDHDGIAYQEIILDHSRHPKNAGVLDDPTGEAQGNNPLCGDRVTVYVKLDGDRIEDVRFDARGCAISVASASMMTEILKGKTVAEAEAEFERFTSQLTGREAPTLAEDDELSALMGVRDFPTRIKCATLPWHTLHAALKVDTTSQVTSAADATAPDATAPEGAGTANDALKSDVIAAISEIFDPEIPVNIYELGLIYDVHVGDEGKVDLVMTLTSPHCPVAEILPGQVKSRVELVDGVNEVDLELTWEPAWTPENMSEAAKLELGFM